MKCHEDECYFLRRELLLRKHLSPLLDNLKINYDEDASPLQNGAIDNDLLFGNQEQNQHDQSNDDDWSDGGADGDTLMHDDNSSSQPFGFGNTKLGEHEISTSSAANSLLKRKLAQADSSVKNASLSGKKIRVKRLKKSGYNIFSKEFRKSLRDTKSSLSFLDMSKEVGRRWRLLTDSQRLDYEEKAKRASIIEVQKAAAEQAAAAAAAASSANLNNANNINNNIATNATTTTNSLQLQNQNSNTAVNSTTTNYYLNSPTHQISPQINQTPINIINNQIYCANPTNAQGQLIYLNQVPNGLAAKQMPYQQKPQQQAYILNAQNFNEMQILQQQQQQQQQENNHPKQVQHKEAYIRYIANMRKQQQLNSQPGYNGPKQTVITPDWYNSIDIRSFKIKENKILPPPGAWIENCNSNDIVQHLLNLRYHLLDDAINIHHTNEDYPYELVNAAPHNDNV
jgi:hypothetical protein